MEQPQATIDDDAPARPDDIGGRQEAAVRLSFHRFSTNNIIMPPPTY